MCGSIYFFFFCVTNKYVRASKTQAEKQKNFNHEKGLGRNEMLSGSFSMHATGSKARTWKPECRDVTHHDIRLSLRYSFDADQFSWGVNVVNLVEEHRTACKEQSICIMD